jgi:hypothetical protein
VFAVVICAGVGWNVYRFLYPPGVPDRVVESVRGDGIRVVATGEDTSPSNDWTVTYLLIEADGPEPVARLRSGLAAHGWSVLSEGVPPDVVLLARRKEARLSMVTFADFHDSGREIPKVLKEFERRAEGREGLLVAVIVPIS